MTDEKLIALWNSRHSDRPTPVRKSSGDYRWDGVLVAVFDTPGGKLRAVVAHPVNTGYVLHIYSAAQIEVATEPAADVLAALLARAERAEAESFALAANLCVAPGSDEYGNHECQTIKTLRADRDRLRAALKPFAEVAAGTGWDALKSEELIHAIGPRLTSGCYIEAGAFRRARAAIAGEKEPT